MSTPTVTAALAPVRAHLLRSALDQAALIRADARRAAADITAQARRDAEAVVARAQSAGQAEAALLSAAELSRAHHEARSLLLGVQREAADALRDQVHAAVATLPHEPGYDQLAHGLTRLARTTAGPGAMVTPDPSGGVVARAPGIRVDCSLTRLADLAVEALGRMRDLWTP